MIAIGLIGTLVICGCSKALTESSAVKVTQKFIDSQDGGTVKTFVGALTGEIGPEYPQPLQQAGVQRLIKEGWLEQKTVTVPYPNFSGEFSGSRENPFPNTPAMVDYFTLQAIADRPPRVQGSFRTCFMNVCDAGTVRGVIQRAGQSSFTLSFQARENPTSDRMVTYNRSLTVSLLRGQPDALVGNYGQGNENPFSTARTTPIRVTGHATGPDIQQEVYVYAWTTKLPNEVISGNTLKLGHLVVDSCAQLLLDSETAARAVCNSHIVFSKAAETIFGNRPANQAVTAGFGKQPDGTWIGTQAIYAPPQYAINQ